MCRLLTAILFMLTLTPQTIFAQTTSDYLILQDISPFKLEGPQKVVGGYIGGPRVFDGAGVIAPTGHFYLDHTDKTYEAYYEGGSTSTSATVQITKHAGSDSNKWLLHELEDGYRDDDNLNAAVDANVQMRTISGKNVYFIGIYGSKSYAWISNNYIVVKIGCSSCPNTKAEPLEIVQAYLQKFPSTITLTDSDFKSRAHSELWIKDEMDRRLWLCDKWFMQLQLKKVDEKQTYQESVKSMNVFLDYREKYYGIKAADEKNLLSSYLNTNNGTSIKAKLTEYKNWWTVNWEKAINL